MYNSAEHEPLWSGEGIFGARHVEDAQYKKLSETQIDAPTYSAPTAQGWRHCFHSSERTSGLRSLTVYYDRCQTNRGSGVGLRVLTVQPIQHETQTEHLCEAAKGLKGGSGYKVL